MYVLFMLWQQVVIHVLCMYYVCIMYVLRMYYSCDGSKW